jgi:hypothetical protein
MHDYISPRKRIDAMRFVLEINFGNEAMRTRTHLATALKEVSKQVAVNGRAGSNGTIRDINGNTVGHWKMVNE